MNPRPTINPVDRLNKLSDTLFGEPDEMGLDEALDLFHQAGIDPEKLKSNLYRRATGLRDQDRQNGKRSPKLLLEMIHDLDPARTSSKGPESPTPAKWISRLLNDIRQLPQLLSGGPEPHFSTAYRKKKELSDSDQTLLDRIREEMRETFKERP